MGYVRSAQVQPLDRCMTKMRFKRGPIDIPIDIKELVRELGDVYINYKDFEKRLNGEAKTKKNRAIGLKEYFFDQATSEASSLLAQKTIQVESKTRAEAKLEAERRNPGWIVAGIQPHDEGFRVIVREDPKFKTFSFVDKERGLVWTKQISSTSATLDDDKLRAEDPELWKRITEERTERVILPLEDLKSEDLAEVQRYIYPGPPQIKLAAPRKAKPEELDD